MKKKSSVILILLCAVLAFGLFGLTGCGDSDTGNEEPNGSTELEEKEYRVSLFFANEAYTNGDETLEKFMVYESEMTSNPGDVYLDALELLKTSPEEGYSTVLTEQIKLNDVYLEGDTVFVDLDNNGLNGGSLDEGFLISQIVNTLINSFDEVKQVQFLIDGEVAESLMGHVGTADPFTKDVFTE